MTRLVTIPVSHFCEKARWALDLAGVPYDEDPWPPALHRIPLARLRTTTAPALVLDDGRTIRGSAAIVRHAGLPGGAEADALMARFDDRLGPATRLLVYATALEDEEIFGRVAGVGLEGWRGSVFRRTRPPVMAVMRWHFASRDTAKVDRALAVVEEELALAERTRGDSPYLVGDRFTAADLTFAALAAPLVFPEQYGAVEFPPFDALPPDLKQRAEHYRATPSGAAVLDLYARHRHPAPVLAEANHA